MHVIWDRSHFGGVADCDTWSAELEEDAGILRHVTASPVVPISIHSDGAFAFTVRAETSTMPRLEPNEKRRIVVGSERYRFANLGHLDASGIEHVERHPSERWRR